MEFQDEIVNAIRQAMPTDAEIQLVSSISGFDVGVSWRLNDDPDRPNKMAKTILIHVSHEAAQDFASASPHNQADAHRRVISFLSQKLADFDPTNNAPSYVALPVERWVINANLLFIICSSSRQA